MKLQRWTMAAQCEGQWMDDYGKWVESADVVTLENRVIELERQLKEGTEDGSRCNRRCEGVMVWSQPDDCSCHINPPCAACDAARPECSFCGWVVE
jgi:hypothetical protein